MPKGDSHFGYGFLCWREGKGGGDRAVWVGRIVGIEGVGGICFGIGGEEGVVFVAVDKVVVRR